MKPKSRAFKEMASQALVNPVLRGKTRRIVQNLQVSRQASIDRLPEFDQLRDRSVEIKDRVFAKLDFYLEEFASKVVERGGEVHWCEDGAAANAKVVELCRKAGATTVVKGKSMLAEEIGLNPFLEAHGIEPVETDVGEHIIQLAKEPPSHIVGPAMHKTTEQISDLYFVEHKRYGITARQTEPQALVAQTRDVIRPSYFSAPVGITGANFLIAETGSTVIVTNEGNGDLCEIVPRVHIVVASIEKMVPTLEDAATMLRVLSRSATGQEITVYTTFSTGPRRPGDLDGPEEFHVVLVDGGRTKLLGTENQALLRCIRCGACMNHCPIYENVGGHAYGWVYPGPIGAALTPALLGIRETRHLPNASSLCGRCEEVCPVRIPLPRIMLKWRQTAFETSVAPVTERFGLRAWGFVARYPRLYRVAVRFAVFFLRLLAGSRAYVRSFPFGGGWTRGRDLPRPEGKTFHDLWRSRRKAG